MEGGRGSRSQLPLMSVDQQHLTNHAKQAHICSANQWLLATRARHTLGQLSQTCSLSPVQTCKNSRAHHPDSNEFPMLTLFQTSYHSLLYCLFAVCTNSCTKVDQRCCSVSGLQFQSWIEPSTCIIVSRIVSIIFKGKCASCNQKAPTATASEHTKSLWGLFHSSSSQISGFCWNFSRNAVELELSSVEAASASSFAAAAVSDRPAAHVPTASNHAHNS